MESAAKWVLGGVLVVAAGAGGFVAGQRVQRALPAPPHPPPRSSGRVFWIHEPDLLEAAPPGKTARPVTRRVLDNPGRWSLIRGLNPVEHTRHGPTDWTTYYNIPRLGKVGISPVQGQRALPDAVGELSIIEMADNTAANRRRLDDYLLDLDRVDVVEASGVFSAWPELVGERWTKRTDARGWRQP